MTSRGLLLSMLCAVGLTWGGVATAADIPKSVKVSESGAFLIDGISARINHYGEGWTRVFQQDVTVARDQGFPSFQGDVWVLKGSLLVSGIPLAIEQRMTPSPDGTVRYEVAVNAEVSVPTSEISLVLELPVGTFAGRILKVGDAAWALASEYDESGFQRRMESFGTLEIPGSPGSNSRIVIKGDGEVLLQDDRKFALDTYSLRFRFNPYAGKEFKQGKLALEMAVLPYDTTPLDMHGAANMGFCDEVAGDGKGGWTDQGSGNDLSMIQVGKQRVGGVMFEVIDPVNNEGRSCLVLGHGERWRDFPSAAEIPVAGHAFRQICLLHATAWTPEGGGHVGTVSVTYGDGTSEAHAMEAGQHVGDWWRPHALPSASVVWTGENLSSYVGLYLTVIPVQEKAIDHISIRSEGAAQWMIVGVSGARDEIPPPVIAGPTYTMPGQDWRALDFPADVVPGSILDFSFLLDHAPAGKHGPLRTVGEHFEFVNQPGHPVKLYGTNINFTANYLDKSTADTLARRLAASGYNSLRISHFDDMLALDKTCALDPARMDQLDYLLIACKQRGIYLTIDLYVSRIIAEGEIPEIKSQHNTSHNIEFKAMVFVDDRALANHQLFARNLLEHINPYTGQAWKDDPALALVSLVNEGTIFHVWRHVRAESPAVREIYERKFAAWRALHEASPGDDEESLMNRFLLDIYGEYLAKMRTFFAAMGMDKPITDQNMVTNVPVLLARSAYDYVDDHAYWDHPSFPETPWGLPSLSSQRSVIGTMLSMPGKKMISRVLGKPMVLTEFNTPMPNCARSESGPIMSAMASLQAWNGLYRFAYSHDARNISGRTPMNYFDTSCDPINALSDRLGAIIFMRGDVRASDVAFPTLIPDPLPPGSLRGDMAFPRISWMLGLVGRVGGVVWTKDSTAASLPPGTVATLALDAVGGTGDVPCIDIGVGHAELAVIDALRKAGGFGAGDLQVEQGLARSSTGEIELDQKAGSFKVVAPRIEVFVFTKNAEIKGHILQAVVNDDQPATVAAVSMDGAELAHSGKILVMHLTDVANTMMKFSDRNRMRMEAFGELPLLARRGTASIFIRLADAEEAPEVWAVDLSGTRIGRVPANVADGVLSFTANTFAHEKVAFAYEVSAVQ